MNRKNKYDDEETYSLGEYHEEYYNHKKEKRIRNALRSKNIDELLEAEDDWEDL